MTKYQTPDSYPVEPIELTPARRELAELLDARTANNADLATLLARQTKLGRAVADIGPLQSELNALTAAEANAMREWSELDTDTPPPVSDVKRRTKIEHAIAAARAARTAADAPPRVYLRRSRASLATSARSRCASNKPSLRLSHRRR